MPKPHLRKYLANSGEDGDDGDDDLLLRSTRIKFKMMTEFMAFCHYAFS